jgi:hypothetical protein
MMSGVDVVVGGLCARREEIEQAIFTHVRTVVPDTVGDGDVEYVAGLRAAVAASLEFVLAGIERAETRSRDLGPEPVPSAAVAQARRAVRSGVSLGTVLRRYTAGYALLGDFVAQEAESAAVGGGLRRLLGAQASSLERLTAAVAEEYACELDRAARSPERRRLELVRELLAGGAEPERADELGYELVGWHLGVVATGAGAARALDGLRAVSGWRMLSLAHGEQTVWAWFAGGQRRLPAQELERLVQAAGSTGVSLAVGEPGRGLAGWRLTHQQAQAALLVALRRPQPVTRYADVALLAAALKDETLTRALLDIYLAPLADSHESGSVLRETLHAYCAAGRNISSTAAAVGVARSTIESRLRTIEERLGRTLHPYPAELQVALNLDRLTR